MIFPRYIGKTPIYRQFIEYRLTVSVKLRTDKISVIGNRLWSNIGNRLSAKFNRYAIPGKSGLPRSWKSHGISGVLKFSGISGKVMEF